MDWQYCKYLFYKGLPKYSCNMLMQLTCYKENLYENINSKRTSTSLRMMFTLEVAAQNLNSKT